MTVEIISNPDPPRSIRGTTCQEFPLLPTIFGHVAATIFILMHIIFKYPLLIILFVIPISAMDSSSTTQQLKHRTKDQSPLDNDTRKRPSSSLPKRGIQSLSVGIAVPLALTLANITLFGWSRSYQTTHKPFWWALHLTCLSSAFVMGLSAWLVWAEGGFHKRPAAMGLYLAQLGLSLAWDPIFFKMGAVKLGLLVCLAQMGTMLSCSRMFARINQTAGDLVKLSLIWAGFLTLVNLYFLV